MSDTSPLDDFSRILERDGVHAALSVLNAQVAHRYTAIYRVDGSMLRNLFLHDKAGEIRPEYLAEVHMGHSFCQFVLRQGAFLTDNSGCDSRLDGHPYKGVMVAYHGVPMTSAAGELIGTLCHFDLEPRGLTNAQFEDLQDAARRLPAYVFTDAPRGASMADH